MARALSALHRLADLGTVIAQERARPLLNPGPGRDRPSRAAEASRPDENRSVCVLATPRPLRTVLSGWFSEPARRGTAMAKYE